VNRSWQPLLRQVSLQAVQAAAVFVNCKDLAARPEQHRQVIGKDTVAAAQVGPDPAAAGRNGRLNETSGLVKTPAVTSGPVWQIFTSHSPL
jgi:hypothetical protein